MTKLKEAREVAALENDRVTIAVFVLDDMWGAEAYDRATGRFLRGYPNLTDASRDRLSRLAKRS